MENDLHDLIQISCEEVFTADAAAEYEAWLDEREAEWNRVMEYADMVMA